MVGGGAVGPYALSDLGLEKSLLSKRQPCSRQFINSTLEPEPEEPLRFVLCELSVSSTGQTIEGSLLPVLPPRGIGRGQIGPLSHFLGR